jgi:hypothetical protein
MCDYDTLVDLFQTATSTAAARAKSKIPVTLF